MSRPIDMDNFALDFVSSPVDQDAPATESELAEARLRARAQMRCFGERYAISMAKYGTTASVKDEREAQQDQENLAFDVLLKVAKYLRLREQVPAVLADYLADAIEHAAKASTTSDVHGNYQNRGAVLLKELNFVRGNSGPRPVLSPAQVCKIVAHLKLLKARDYTYMTSQKELAKAYRVSLKTIQRIWAEHKESNPDAE